MRHIKTIIISHKLTLETHDNNLDTVKNSDGTVSLLCYMPLKKDPKELFPPEKSNFTAARHQTEKTFKRFSS